MTGKSGLVVAASALAMLSSLVVAQVPTPRPGQPAAYVLVDTPQEKAGAPRTAPPRDASGRIVITNENLPTKPRPTAPAYSWGQAPSEPPPTVPPVAAPVFPTVIPEPTVAPEPTAIPAPPKPPEKSWLPLYGIGALLLVIATAVSLHLRSPRAIQAPAPRPVAPRERPAEAAPAVLKPKERTPSAVGIVAILFGLLIFMIGAAMGLNLIVCGTGLIFIIGGYLTRPDEPAKLCPACRMKVPLEATICGHCRSPLTPVPPA